MGCLSASPQASARLALISLKLSMSSCEILIWSRLLGVHTYQWVFLTDVVCSFGSSWQCRYIFELVFWNLGIEPWGGNSWNFDLAGLLRRDDGPPQNSTCVTTKWHFSVVNFSPAFLMHLKTALMFSMSCSVVFAAIPTSSTFCAHWSALMT